VFTVTDDSKYGLAWGNLAKAITIAGNNHLALVLNEQDNWNSSTQLGRDMIRINK